MDKRDIIDMSVANLIIGEVFLIIALSISDHLWVIVSVGQIMVGIILLIIWLLLIREKANENG